MATFPEWLLLLSRLVLEQVPFQNPPVSRSEIFPKCCKNRNKNSSHGLTCLFTLDLAPLVREQDKLLLNGECT